jgi:hypothetical protein
MLSARASGWTRLGRDLAGRRSWIRPAARWLKGCVEERFNRPVTHFVAQPPGPRNV